MTKLIVNLTEEHIEELVEHVNVNDYLTYCEMSDFNDYMSGLDAINILDAVDFAEFDTSDMYAVYNARLGLWQSKDELSDVLEDYLDVFVQVYLDNNLT